MFRKTLFLILISLSFSVNARNMVSFTDTYVSDSKRFRQELSTLSDEELAAQKNLNIKMTNFFLRKISSEQLFNSFTQEDVNAMEYLDKKGYSTWLHFISAYYLTKSLKYKKNSIEQKNYANKAISGFIKSCNQYAIKESCEVADFFNGKKTY